MTILRILHSKRVILLFVLLFMSLGPELLHGYEWTKTFGETSWDFADCVRQTSDGGYILVGTAETRALWPEEDPVGDISIYLIKTDGLGNELWHTYHTANTFYSYGVSVNQTSDGGFIISGGGTFDDNKGCLLKTDANGQEQWKNCFGAGFDPEYGDFSVYPSEAQQTTDGGYIWTGSMGNGYYYPFLEKTDADGNVLWKKIIDQPGRFGSDTAALQQTSDNSYIITGTKGYGHQEGDQKPDIILIKADENGEEIWSKTIGASGSEKAYAVQQTMDGGYVVVGVTDSIGAGKLDAYLVKTDADGNEVWSKTYGGPEDDHGVSVDKTTDGGYIITGSTRSFGAGNSDVYLIKTDSDGQQVWSKTFGGPDDDEGRSVRQTNDGGYIVAGNEKSDNNSVSEAYLIYYSPSQLSDPAEEAPTSKTANEDGEGDGGCIISAMQN